MIAQRILRKCFRSKLISGCAMPTPLLERFTLIRAPFGQLRVHHFFRSDEDRELHDHPWAFVTFILSGGYTEQIPVRPVRKILLDPNVGHEAGWTVGDTERVWRRPGSLLYRPARWAHRVEIAAGKDAWTLIWMFARTRPWGFFLRSGWLVQERYHAIAACVDDTQLERARAAQQR
jgi:hypothetical protein